VFNIGPGELIAISMVALIVLGPQRLPHAVRTVGRVVGELRRISGGFQDELRNAIDDSELDELRRRTDISPPSLPPLPDDLPDTATPGSDVTWLPTSGSTTPSDASIPPAARHTRGSTADAGAAASAEGPPSGAAPADIAPAGAASVMSPEGGASGGPAATRGEAPTRADDAASADDRPEREGRAGPPDASTRPPREDAPDSAPTTIDGEAPPAGGATAAAS
jgi:sec-independent protein translocase protein TatB